MNISLSSLIMYYFKKLILRVKTCYKIIVVRIWKTQDPNFCPETVYPDWRLSKFSLVPPDELWGVPSNCAETARSNILFISLPSNNLAGVEKLMTEMNY